MIDFNNLCKEAPYALFQEKYKEALDAGQKNIEAVSISSFNKKINEVDSRFVNLKIIKNEEFIFFSNYRSPKNNAFESHNQIAATFFWSSTNTQIRIKAKIKKTSHSFNKSYFKNRAISKNALAISSNQSEVIASYDAVVEKYNNVLEVNDLSECPEYWGGFSFLPYSIEFWKGNPSRLNKRDLYVKDANSWNHSILEP